MALRGSQLARAYAGAPIDDAMQDAETDYDETDSSDGGMQLDVISANGEVPLLETLDPPSSIPSEFQGT